MQSWLHKYALTYCDADPENDAWMILVFNNGTFTNLEIEDWIGNFPLSVCSVQTFVIPCLCWSYCVFCLAGLNAVLCAKAYGRSMARSNLQHGC